MHQCADGAWPGLRRLFCSLKRCSCPVAIVVLAVAGTVVLYCVSTWLMLDATSVGTLTGR